MTLLPFVVVLAGKRPRWGMYIGTNYRSRVVVRFFIVISLASSARNGDTALLTARLGEETGRVHEAARGLSDYVV